MRRWKVVVLAALVLLAAYWVWPLVGAAELASVARTNDAAEVMDRVDLPALRRSLAVQVANAYLDVTGKARKLGTLGRSVAGAAVTTVADPYLAELLTPENIMALLSQGKVNPVKLNGKAVDVAGALPRMQDLVTSDLLSRITGSYFDGIASFVVPVAGHGSDDQFRIHLRLHGLTWRLSGLDLPAGLVEEMARGVMANAGTPPAQ